MSGEALLVKNLRKVYGDTVAVNDISFKVDRNEIVGLLGPNGAGKTTTINMILGILQPTSGSITIDDMDINLNRSETLKRTNFAAVYADLPGNLTVYQNLHIFGLLYGVEDVMNQIDLLIERFDLKKFRSTKCGVLSSGEQTRVNLAKAMINNPDLLLLDEPTSSLDPAVARDIRSNICEFVAGRGCGVLWTSHNMYEVEIVCDRVLFLSRGKILLKGDPKTLPREHGEESLENLFIKVAREPLSLEGM
ncbi:MAG: ABC transporter ATP-binding protein [bacterium]|nr:ABC transporter ATP-binding protein [bacterium]